MQLIHRIAKEPSSTEYLKQHLSNIEKFRQKTIISEVLKDEFFPPVSIISEYYTTQEPFETSITSKRLRLIEKLIEKLEEQYIFENPKEIKPFLLTNDYLIEILFEATIHIYRIFGEVPIYLELHHDPEDGWDELFIVIKSKYSAEEAIKLENRLAEEWFLNRIKDTRGKLNIIEEPL